MSGHGGGVTRLDSGHAKPARIYDYWLGGRENFAVDRRAAENAILINPQIVGDVRAHRAFLARAVQYLARECGIRQFLDIGTGLPATGSPHEVAQTIAPDTRVVYVDNDPVVLSHARAMLTSGFPGAGAIDYVDADLREPEAILNAAAATLDFTEPVAVLLMVIVHLIPDRDDPYGIVDRLMRAVPGGSYLAMAHPASDIRTEQQAEMTRRLNAWMDGPQATMRDRAAVRHFFDGLDLVEPGLVQPQQWRPSAPRAGTAAVPAQVTSWCGVGRKRLKPAYAGRGTAYAGRGNWVSDSVLPSRSVNHATMPPGEFQMPSSSWSIMS
jgi:S-adenosyl methyltransferase